VEQLPVGSQVGGRYYITARRIWLDTQPSLPPDVSNEWSEAVLPYLYLYPYRLHVPEVYGFCPQEDGGENEIFLLENVPLDADGILASTIATAWSHATAVRQVYWLWQILQLWEPLAQLNVATSLLATDNIRVEGWRVRLCQLWQDADVLPPEADPKSGVALADLANLWLSWANHAQPEVRQPLRDICQQMQAEPTDLDSISAQLNHLLLEQAAHLPLRLHILGGTTTGPERSHNEDACYPLPSDLLTQPEGTLSRIAIVCDGIGGHEGGEVASQLTVQTLKLELQALLKEVAQQDELMAPDTIAQQIEAAIRVANNLIANQNDAQGRADRRRMGTTLVLSVQIPQAIKTASGATYENGHELYLANVGDSRAYWITQRYCQPLTVDDDVAAREVRMGRALYRESLYRPDAGALTQAVGTRDADLLRPSVQRLILEEDGLLLLCSDGVSDNGLVERTWKDIAVAVLGGRESLDWAVRTWLNLANQHNGYDNATIVLVRCHVSSALPSPSLPNTTGSQEWRRSSSPSLPTEDTEIEGATSTKPDSPRHRPLLRISLLLLGLLLLGGVAGLFAWSHFDPTGFQQMRQRIVPQLKSS
jgi:protein phosphatase